MDCKKFSRLISEVDDFDENLLSGQAKLHLSKCDNCQKELEWLKTVQGDLKSVALPDPGQQFFEDLTARVHIKLLTGNIKKQEATRSWLNAAWDWFGRPSFAYGLSAVAVALALVVWAVPMQKDGFQRFQQTSPVTFSSDSVAPVTYASASISPADPALPPALNSLSEPELRTAMKALIHKSFNRDDLENIDEPFSTAERDTYLSSDLNQLDRQGLQTVSYLLNQRYPH